jgi:hypothetical protein
MATVICSIDSGLGDARVTGATSGIGRAAAVRLARDGGMWSSRAVTRYGVPR